MSSMELELARAALAGDDGALRTIDGWVAHLKVSDEARQAVRQRVLVEGRLREFDGRGSLRAWLKTVAVRLEVDLVRAVREDAVEDRVLDALLAPSAHLEAELVTTEARALMKKALTAALERLSPRERLWVQHYHLDGMTLTAIARLYSAAPSTVMRAIDRSLEDLRELAKEHLSKTHRLGVASLESLVRHGVP